MRYSLFFLLAVAACDAPTESPTSVAEALVTTNSTWLRKADYPTTTYGAASASYTDPTTKKSTVYVLGGNSRSVSSMGSISDAVKAYDVASNTWKAKARLPRRLQEAAAVELNGKIYLAGGVTRVWDARRSVWRKQLMKSLFVYDVATNTWTRKADLPTTTSYPVMVVSNGSIYLAGPCFDTGFCGPAQVSLAVLKYSISANAWTLESHAEPVTYPGLVTGGAINGKLYLVGVSEGYHAVYDLTTKTWSLGPVRPYWRCSPMGSITLEAKLYQIGCLNDANEQAIMAFDPVTGSWAALPPAPLQAGTLSRVMVSGVRRLELVNGKQNWQGLP